MPTTDAYGQGISIASPTDPPDIPAAIQAVAAGVIPRGVNRYTSASQRNATITSPVGGMVAFLATEKLLTLYDGAAWVVIAAGASTWSTISMASGYAHNGNDNGNAQYRIVNLAGELSVMLQGGINVPYSGSPATIGNGGILNSVALPSAARPGSLRTVAAACSQVTSTSNTVKLDAQSDGYLRIVGTTPSNATNRVTPPWVSLNGLFYSL
ncbi:hypothetical protein [Streptomyces candidus]|uniref:Uncharacterized protein n=1 Tax=Streptomyces candidus TaxID=67283 RepID=A0A7X0HLZ2_9ACTN|nr:hypothetical protein [Streptomyces candidus]MBB6439908.1 hypothetical protein [Streptomyces candidus]GHH57881.1 hypothetical protein GCM10018773_65830 [Streptomyces candidus]